MTFRTCALAYGILLTYMAAGCGPTITGFPKQEFVVQEKPVVHLALRGSRKGRKVVCQIFLLTMNKAMWISGADLRLADGTLLDPKEVQSLDEIDRDDSRRMWVGLGSRYDRRPYYRDYPYYRRDWRPGPYSRYRTRSGVSVPAWYLLGRSRGDNTPSGLELTYELPEAQPTSNGIEARVHVAVKPQKAKEARADPEEKPKGKDEAEAAAHGERKIRSLFAFSLSEKPRADDAQEKGEPNKILYEIQFTPLADDSRK